MNSHRQAATGAPSTEPRTLRIVFVMPHQRHARRFELMLGELTARGHQVHLALKGEIHPEADRLIGRLAADDAITRGPAPARDDSWAVLARSLRHAIDYLRYLAPDYAGARKLRARAAGLAPAWTVRVASWPWVRRPAGLRALDRVLRWVEGAIPDSRAIVEFLRGRHPDLLLVSPLVDRPWQADYLRAARSLGIRSALCVASWDNLTNKGLIRDVPDRVYLWNDDQRQEAVELHGVPPDRVVATGAHSFDHWFGWKPSVGVEGFRDKVGLSRRSELLLYVCSSKFIAPDEPSFVARWLDALRAHSDPLLRGADVLIRPHPTTGKDWKDSPLGQLPGVAVWPPQGAVNVDDASKSDYFDSIHHSRAVIGVNTSALIESAIVGRPVFTVLVPDFADSQEGTLHFRYLLRERGGPLTVAQDFEQHFTQLAAVLNGPPAGTERGFVRRFIRPHGLDRPAAGVMADAIEQQAAQAAPSPSPAGLGRRLGSHGLAPTAVLAASGGGAGKRRRGSRAALRLSRRPSA